MGTILDGIEFQAVKDNKKRMASTKGNATPSDVNDDCSTELSGRRKMRVAVERGFIVKNTIMYV
jgi:ABC-type polar amino acid transport system ATPase subunit